MRAVVPKRYPSSSCDIWGGLILDIEQRNTSMNLFPCRQEGVWQCEWHNDCTSNFTLQTSGFAIIIRDDQQPTAPAASSTLDMGAIVYIALTAVLLLLFVSIGFYPLCFRRRKSKLASGPTFMDHVCDQSGHGVTEVTDQSVQMGMDAAVIKAKITALVSEVGNGR